jgi:hypothetical protein
VSSLNQKLEQALRHAIRARAADPTSDDEESLYEGEGTVIATESGLAIVFSSGTTLDVPVYVGESEEELNPPCISVVCANANRDEDSPWYFCQAVIEVRYGADSDSFTADKVAALDSLSEMVASILWEDDFQSILSEQVRNFTCHGRTSEGSRDRFVENRTRIHRYGMTLYCIEADIEN